MKLPKYLPSSNQPEDAYTKDLDRSLDKIMAVLFEMLNNGLNFDDNFNCFKTEITTSSLPGTETQIAHGLKRPPTGMLILRTDKAAHVFEGPTAISARLSATEAAVLSENYYIQSDQPSVRVSLVIL